MGIGIFLAAATDVGFTIAVEKQRDKHHDGQWPEMQQQILIDASLKRQ